MHLIFLYKLQDTYAVGVLDGVNATVHHGAKSGWVVHRHTGGTERYFLESSTEHLRVCDRPEDIAAYCDRFMLLGLPLAENPLPPQDGPVLQEIPVYPRTKKGHK